jgi:hypothetical protein
MGMVPNLVHLRCPPFTKLEGLQCHMLLACWQREMGGTLDRRYQMILPSRAALSPQLPC